MKARSARPGRAGVTASGELTLRERQVLALRAVGLSNREVGLRLFLSEQTVKFHLTHVFRKLGAKNTAHAVTLALRDGILVWGASSDPGEKPMLLDGRAELVLADPAEPREVPARS